MRRVEKGKLAGRPLATDDAMGLAGLGPQDAQGLAAAAMGGLFDAALYLDDQGEVLACSAGFLDRSGLEADEVVGGAFRELGQSEDDRARMAMALSDARASGSGAVAAKLRSNKARALPATIKLTATAAGESRKWLATMSLWTAEREREGRPLPLCAGDFDAATGMLGRSGFLLSGAQAYEREGFKDRPCLIAIDLDALGSVNERFGNEAGDRIIEGVGARLRAQARRGDLAARLGSDEFCLYASFAGNPGDAEAICARLASAIEQPFEVAPGVIEMVGATLGVALGPKDGVGIGDLLCSAERALRAAKKATVRIGWAEPLAASKKP